MLTLTPDSLITQTITLFDGRIYDLEEFEYFPEQKELLVEYIEEAEDLELKDTSGENKAYHKRYHSVFRYMDGIFLEVENCGYWSKE